MNPKRNFDLEYWKTSPKTRAFYLIFHYKKQFSGHPRALRQLINHFLDHKICPVSWDTLYNPLLLDLMI